MQNAGDATDRTAVADLLRMMVDCIVEVEQKGFFQHINNPAPRLADNQGRSSSQPEETVEGTHSSRQQRQANASSDGIRGTGLAVKSKLSDVLWFEEDGWMDLGKVSTQPVVKTEPNRSTSDTRTAAAGAASPISVSSESDSQPGDDSQATELRDLEQLEPHFHQVDNLQAQGPFLFSQHNAVTMLDGTQFWNQAKRRREKLSQGERTGIFSLLAQHRQAAADVPFHKHHHELPSLFLDNMASQLAALEYARECGFELWPTASAPAQGQLPPEQRRNVHKYSINCVSCGRVFSTLQRYSLHAASHSRPAEVSCRACPERGPARFTNFAKHVMGTHLRGFTCPICGHFEASRAFRDIQSHFESCRKQHVRSSRRDEHKLSDKRAGNDSAVRPSRLKHGQAIPRCSIHTTTTSARPPLKGGVARSKRIVFHANMPTQFPPGASGPLPPPYDMLVTSSSPSPSSSEDEESYTHGVDNGEPASQPRSTFSSRRTQLRRPQRRRGRPSRHIPSSLTAAPVEATHDQAGQGRQPDKADRHSQQPVSGLSQKHLGAQGLTEVLTGQASIASASASATPSLRQGRLQGAGTRAASPPQSSAVTPKNTTSLSTSHSPAKQTSKGNTTPERARMSRKTTKSAVLDRHLPKDPSLAMPPLSPRRTARTATDRGHGKLPRETMPARSKSPVQAECSRAVPMVQWRHHQARGVEANLSVNDVYVVSSSPEPEDDAEASKKQLVVASGDDIKASNSHSVVVEDPLQPSLNRRTGNEKVRDGRRRRQHETAEEEDAVVSESPVVPPGGKRKLSPSDSDGKGNGRESDHQQSQDSSPSVYLGRTKRRRRHHRLQDFLSDDEEGDHDIGKNEAVESNAGTQADSSSASPASTKEVLFEQARNGGINEASGPGVDGLASANAASSLRAKLQVLQQSSYAQPTVAEGTDSAALVADAAGVASQRRTRSSSHRRTPVDETSQASSRSGRRSGLGPSVSTRSAAVSASSQSVRITSRKQIRPFPWVCGRCGRRYRYRTDLVIHQVRKHNIQDGLATQSSLAVDASGGHKMSGSGLATTFFPLNAKAAGLLSNIRAAVRKLQLESAPLLKQIYEPMAAEHRHCTSAEK